MIKMRVCRKRKTILEGVGSLLERVGIQWCHVYGYVMRLITLPYLFCPVNTYDLAPVLSLVDWMTCDLGI